MLHHRRHFCKHLAVAFLLLLVAIVLGVPPLARGRALRASPSCAAHASLRSAQPSRHSRSETRSKRDDCRVLPASPSLPRRYNPSYVFCQEVLRFFYSPASYVFCQEVLRFFYSPALLFTLLLLLPPVLKYGFLDL